MAVFKLQHHHHHHRLHRKMAGNPMANPLRILECQVGLAVAPWTRPAQSEDRRAKGLDNLLFGYDVPDGDDPEELPGFVHND